MKIYLALVYHTDDPTEILYCGTDRAVAELKLNFYPRKEYGYPDPQPSLEIWEDGVCIEGDSKLEEDTE